MQRRIISLLISVVLLCGMSLTAFAHDVPDLTRTGTIEITMKTGETTVPGGTVTAIRVGEIWEEDGNYSFRLNEQLRDSGLSLEDIQSPELAADLARYAEEHDLGGKTQTVDREGHVSFADLELGLYLVVQKKAAEGYCAISPFLIGLPNLEDGVYVYEVDASPKVDLEPAPEEPDKPTPEKPKDETLPQTGQLNWPVPLLAVSGLALFFMGWVMRFKGRKNGHET